MIPGVLPRGGDFNWILKNEMYEMAKQAGAFQAERRAFVKAEGRGEARRSMWWLQEQCVVPGDESLDGE